MDKRDNLWIGPLIAIKDDSSKGFQIKWNIKRLFDKNNYQIYHLFLVIGDSKS